VKRGIVTLRGEVDRRSEKESWRLWRGGWTGVVGVKDELSYRTDDRELRPETPRSDLGWGENWRRPRS
jgi:hypothetical protein